jgi:hypothetical protein
MLSNYLVSTSQDTRITVKKSCVVKNIQKTYTFHSENTQSRRLSKLVFNKTYTSCVFKKKIPPCHLVAYAQKQPELSMHLPHQVPPVLRRITADQIIKEPDHNMKRKITGFLLTLVI